MFRVLAQRCASDGMVVVRVGAAKLLGSVSSVVELDVLCGFLHHGLRGPVGLAL